MECSTDARLMKFLQLVDFSHVKNKVLSWWLASNVARQIQRWTEQKMATWQPSLHPPDHILFICCSDRNKLKACCFLNRMTQNMSDVLNFSNHSQINSISFEFDLTEQEITVDPLTTQYILFLLRNLFHKLSLPPSSYQPCCYILQRFPKFSISSQSGIGLSRMLFKYSSRIIFIKIIKNIGWLRGRILICTVV